jgi:hypothetical protein
MYEVLHDIPAPSEPLLRLLCPQNILVALVTMFHSILKIAALQRPSSLFLSFYQLQRCSPNLSTNPFYFPPEPIQGPPGLEFGPFEVKLYPSVLDVVLFCAP